MTAIENKQCKQNKETVHQTVSNDYTNGTNRSYMLLRTRERKNQLDWSCGLEVMKV
jgi:hypothetical protein